MVAGCVLGAPRNGDVGGKYLGATYVADPLGEGVGYDSDPLLRTDAFDCVTFVETVLADGDVGRLGRIRYRDGRVDFKNRNHFIETDWLNANDKLVENISDQYGDAAVRHVVIDKRTWAKTIHNMDIDTDPQAADIKYLPYSDLPKIQNKEAVIVLFIVGPNDTKTKLGTDLAVVHMGFLLPGGKILRHASTGRGVVDDDFAQYLEMRQRMRNNIGIALVKIK